MELLITGSREFDNYFLMCETLTPFEDRVTKVIHGAAPGADALASQWAYENRIDVKAYGALWGRYGKKAGAIRNSKMLRFHPDAFVVAFPLPGSRGTWDCVRKARKREMRVLVIEGQE